MNAMQIGLVDGNHSSLLFTHVYARSLKQTLCVIQRASEGCEFSVNSQRTSKTRTGAIVPVYFYVKGFVLYLSTSGEHDYQFFSVSVL